MKSRLARLQRYLDRPWYPLLIGLVAAIDAIVVVIPVDGLTIAAILSRPQRWVRLALASAAGNLIGAGIIAEGVYRNADWIHQRFGPTLGTPVWQEVEQFIQSHGSWAVILGAITPIPLPFWVLVPALAGMPAVTLFVALLISRVARALAVCWAASHAPRLLRRSRGLMKEVEEVKPEGMKSDD